MELLCLLKTNTKWISGRVAGGTLLFMADYGEYI